MIKYIRSLLREWSVYGQLVEVVGKVGSKTGIIIKEIHTAKVLVLVLAFYALVMEKLARIQLADQGNPESVMLAKNLNRRLSIQNNQLNNRWAKVRDSLDRIKGFTESKVERDKSEMLKYQDKLKGSSGNFSSPEISTANSTPRRRSISLNMTHVEAMKHTWLEKAAKSRPRQLSVSSEALAQSFTISSEKKRAFRRRASLSLFELQKMNEEFNGKSRGAEFSKTFLTDSLEEEPSTRRESIFDIVESEEVEPIRIPPSVHLPPIHQVQPAKLSTRSFEKDADFEKRKSGELVDTGDLKYCRYLRNASQKSIA